MKIALILIYLISVFSWGCVSFIFISELHNLKKNKREIPSLLLPFTTASVAFVIEGIYYGMIFIDKYLLSAFPHLPIEEVLSMPDYLVIPELIIAISGLFILFELKIPKE